MSYLTKTFLLGVGFNNLKNEDALEYIITSLGKIGERYYVVTPNPEILVIADTNKKYKEVLNGAKLALVDGIGILIASKIMGLPLNNRFHGVDLVENLCREVSKRPITTGFLGAGPGVAVKTSECLKNRYPGLKINFATEEWEDSLKSRKVDILFVALGSPKQELWIAENLNMLPAKVVIGVGGAFDFISGKVVRAPHFMRKLGLEWLFRLIIQPWRIKRQLRLIKFLYLVVREKVIIK